MTIRGIMNAKPTFVCTDEKATRILENMEKREKPFLVLRVLDCRQRVVGMIHLHDLVARGL